MSVYMGTTKIAANKTVGEIQMILAKSGAVGINLQFDGGEPCALEFVLPNPTGDGQYMHFSLPCRWEAVKAKLVRVRAPDRSDEQAKRTAWRQVLRWLQAQLEMIDTGQVQSQEVFLPYLLMNDGGERVRLFDRIVRHDRLLPSS